MIEKKEGYTMSNPLQEILKQQPFIVQDGAFATELERAGFVINDPLWSAIALYEKPELVKQVYRSYLNAGADVLITASYQGTVEGFMKKGFSKEKSKDLIRLSVRLAKEVRDEFWADNQDKSRAYPLIAASVGPYGAHLADGSEYRGNYGVSRKTIADFHRENIGILAEEEPDLFACETVPSFLEAQALGDALSSYPESKAWISFSCKDGHHTCEGNPITECAAFLDTVPEVLAIGVNCCPPGIVESLVRDIKSVTDKVIVVYPNSGETYDPASKTWKGSAVSYADYAKSWYDAGARFIGGCCRTTPDDIRAVRNVLDSLR